jgi:hypothetical protein
METIATKTSASSSSVYKKHDLTPRLPIRNVRLQLSPTMDTTMHTNVNNDNASTGSTSAPIVMEYTTTVNTGTYHIQPRSKIITTTTRSQSKQTESGSIPMPGIHGPHPITSSGTLPLHILNCGEYVTWPTGTQSVPFTTTSSDTHQQLQPQWEIIWRESSPTGTLVLGMELLQSIQKNNNSMIPAGTMYMSFPIWDGRKLQDYQMKKKEYDKTSKQYSQERDAALERMTQTNNVLTKLVHYRDAFQAAENYSLQPHKLLQHIPTTMNDLIEVVMSGSNDDDDSSATPLYIARKGTVRIVSNHKNKLNTKSTTLTTPCGKQILMNRMVSNSKTDPQRHTGDIVHGTATIRTAADE